MRAVQFHNKKRFLSNGFFLVEVVVATAVIAFVIVTLLGAISKSIQVSTLALQKTQASYLLDEGSEALKFVRNASWTTIANATVGTPYGITWNGNTWILSATAQPIDGFTRSIVFTTANRDATSSDIVATGGTVDAGTRKAVIMVSWQSQNGVVVETLPLYLANINS